MATLSQSTSAIPRFLFLAAPYATPGNLFTMASGLEAGFYSTLQAGKRAWLWPVNWIREASIRNINEIQTLFNLVDIGSTVYFSKKLSEAIITKFPINTSNALVKELMKFQAPWILTGAATLGVVAGLFRFVSPTLAPERTQTVDETPYTITESQNNAQKAARFLQLAKLVTGVALACLQQNYALAALTVLTSGYSLYKDMQLKTVNISCDHDISANQENGDTYDATVQPLYGCSIPATLTKATVTYHVLSVPSAEGQNTLSVCADHVVEANDIAPWAHGLPDPFASNIAIKPTDDHYYANGQLMNIIRNYTIALPEENWPRCHKEGCVLPTPQHQVSIVLHKTETFGIDGKKVVKCNTSVIKSKTIPEPTDPSDRYQEAWEFFHTIYSVAQVVLTALQRYPELTAKVLQIQRYMMISDAVAIIATGSALYTQLEKEYEAERPEVLRAALVVALVAAGILSYGIVTQLNAVLSPVLAVSSILQDLPIAQDTLKNTSFSWTVPDKHKHMQTLSLTRIITTIALACFSDQHKMNMINLGAQTLNLLGISQLRWLQLTQTFEYPLKKIVAEGGSLVWNLQATSLKELRVYSSYLVDPNASWDSSILTSTVTSIYQHTTPLFDKSHWERYWDILVDKGREVSKTLTYQVTLQPLAAPTSTLGFAPELTDLAMSGVDATLGYAVVRSNF